MKKCIKYKGGKTIQLDIVCNDTKYLPTYANDTDACMDLKVKIEEKYYSLKPSVTKIFGTGIQVIEMKSKWL